MILYWRTYLPQEADYVPEVNKETGEMKISLSGLDEFRKAKAEPAPLPE